MVNEDKAKSKRDLFGDSTKNRNMGTRRLNRMPLLILMLLGGVVMAAIGYTYYSKTSSSSSSKKDDEKKPASASASSLLMNAPLAGLIDANKTIIDDPTVQVAKQKPPVVTKTAPNISEVLQKQLDELLAKPKPPEPAPVAPLPPSPPPIPEPTEEEKQAMALARARQAALNAAIMSATTIAGGQKGGAQSSTDVPAVSGSNPYATNVSGFNAGAGAAVTDPDKDPGKQQEKKDFLNQKPDQTSDTLQNSRILPSSPYEVKAGTIISSVMISGINSDIPGQVIGQVSENVYDTATGSYVLIPQGARIIGSFDNSVSTGQQRVLVVWRRIIYPDASSVNLDIMPGADQAGYSGMSDQVDNHYLQTFGNAFLLSILSAAGQLSQPSTNNNSSDSSGNSTSNSAQQTAAAALGQQLTQLGTQMVQKNMNVPPTLTIRPGSRFIIMVNKDMLLSPWTHKQTK